MPAQDKSSAASSPTIALSAPSALRGRAATISARPGVEPGFRGTAAPSALAAAAPTPGVIEEAIAESVA